MTRSIFGLVGAGGLGREVMPFASSILKEMEIESFFVEKKCEQTSINSYRALSETNFFQLKCEKKYFNITIGSSFLREIISKKFLEKQCKPFTLKAKSCIIYDDVVLGEGAILCDNTIITSNIQIGKFFQANIYSYVAHDCMIGNYVTFAPKVCCNGRVKIEDHAYIGTGAIIKEGITIGKGAVIGAGAVVVKNVLPNTTVIGNPAKIMEKR